MVEIEEYITVPATLEVAASLGYVVITPQAGQRGPCLALLTYASYLSLLV